MERRWTDDAGRSWTVRPQEEALVFAGDEGSYTVATARARELASLDDAELRTIFESAVTDDDGGPAIPRSPSAVGRESAPHVDAADYDPEAD